MSAEAHPPLPLQEFLPAQPASPALQTPLPLQEFLPAQPSSPALQPPLPLQEFLPAQTCLSEEADWSLAFSSPAVVFALPLLAGVIAVARPEPASTPAIARPIALVVRSPFFIRVLLSSPPSGAPRYRSSRHGSTVIRASNRSPGHDRARTVAESYPSRTPAVSSRSVCSILRRSREQYADVPPGGSVSLEPNM